MAKRISGETSPKTSPMYAVALAIKYSGIGTNENIILNKIKLPCCQPFIFLSANNIVP